MTLSSPLRLGTRGSQLALYQARTVQRLLAETGGPPCDIVVIKTSGDRLQDAPLSELGGKRLFVKEIEDALLQNAIDLAVHSSKDMPAVLPEGLDIAGVLPREDPHDAVVLPIRDQGSGIGVRVPDLQALLTILGTTPTIGTSSIRRVAQLSRLLPGARFAPIRGNLDTRLRKLDVGTDNALVLAAAGLRRLGFGARASFTLPVSACVPAPGQGIIAVETRADDDRVRAVVHAITDPEAALALMAERSLVEALGGGCQTPIGALATVHDGGDLELVAIVVAVDGSRAVRAAARGTSDAPATLGARVADMLRADGAEDILEDARRRQREASSRAGGS